MKTMTSERIPFIVERDGDQAVAAMCCDGLSRVRPMHAEFLEDMAEICQRLRDEFLNPLKNGEKRTDKLNQFPKGTSIANCDMGPCVAHLYGSEMSDGSREYGIAFYDAEDEDRRPVIVLVEEQIDEFISRVTEAMEGYERLEEIE